MAKKALRNTFIFTLVVINLIIWPSLFFEFNGESEKVSSEQVNNKTHNIGSETETAVPESPEETSDTAVKNEDSSVEGSAEEKSFKILRIE